MSQADRCPGPQLTTKWSVQLSDRPVVSGFSHSDPDGFVGVAKTLLHIKVRSLRVIEASPDCGVKDIACAAGHEPYATHPWLNIDRRAEAQRFQNLQ